MSTPTNSSGGRTAITTVFLLIALVLGIIYAKHKYASSAEKAKTETPAGSIYVVAREKQRVVVDECDTPCTMYVGLDQFIETGNKEYRAKFNRRGWITLSGRPDDPIPAEKFNSGEAQFDSPKNAPSMHIQIKELR